MSTALIEASQLSIGYPGKTVGRGINLRVRPGRILCLLGPNGIGKSTLFKTLLGLLPPHGGDVRVLERPLRDWPPHELARQIAYVPQAQESPLPLAANEIVLLGRAAQVPMFASPSQADRDVALRCLQTLEIGHLAARRYDQLSGGEKQMVLIARALAQEPAALIMDEPTASLDFGNQVRVLKQMRRLADAGMGILFCTHQPGHARRVADEVILFKEGGIQAEGPPRQVLTRERIAWLYDLDPADLDGPDAAASEARFPA